jgi:BirA family biotin operon repressor/biotin-[acetyl-CoA-carboxylase] ligase
MSPPYAHATGPDGITIEWHDRVASTQDLARERALAGPIRRLAVIANAQSAGRGQRGRRWESPAGAALYLTLAWPTPRPLSGMAGLSLVVGLAVRAMLMRLGLVAKLKWPNDLWLDGHKLAGILVDLLSLHGRVVALIGIGLNRRLPPEAVAAIDQPVADLAGALDAPPPLDALALALLDELGQTLQRFDAGGFEAFVDEWPAADALAGLPVRITAEGREALRGTARGVDAMGRLLVHTADGVFPVAAGAAAVRRDDSRDTTEFAP